MMYQAETSVFTYLRDGEKECFSRRNMTDYERSYIHERVTELRHWLADSTGHELAGYALTRLMALQDLQRRGQGVFTVRGDTVHVNLITWAIANEWIWRTANGYALTQKGKQYFQEKRGAWYENLS